MVHAGGITLSIDEPSTGMSSYSWNVLKYGVGVGADTAGFVPGEIDLGETLGEVLGDVGPPAATGLAVAFGDVVGLTVAWGTRTLNT